MPAKRGGGLPNTLTSVLYRMMMLPDRVQPRRLLLQVRSAMGSVRLSRLLDLTAL